MTDIYKQKARKYKNKYLKLKQEYIAKGGVIFRRISGCTIIPPPKFSYETLFKLQISRNYPLTSISDSKSQINSFCNPNNFGRLLSYNDYQKELENFKSLNPAPNFFFDPVMEEYVKIKYACLIEKEKSSKSTLYYSLDKLFPPT